MVEPEVKDVIGFIKAHMDELHHDFHIKKIGVFGSFARGTQTERSDIDLLVEFEPDTPNIHALKKDLKKYFKDRFHRKIDIAREKYLKPFVRDDIINETIYIQ